jgi:hypothetical protein
MSSMFRGPRVRSVLPTLSLAALALGSSQCGLDLGQPAAVGEVTHGAPCEGAACDEAPALESLATDLGDPGACLDVAHADGASASAVLRSAAIARLGELGVEPSWVAVSKKAAPCPGSDDPACGRWTARVDVAAIATARIGTLVLEEREVLAPLSHCDAVDACTGATTDCATGVVGQQHLRLGAHVSTPLTQSVHDEAEGVLDVHVPFHASITGNPGVGATAQLLDACTGVPNATLHDVAWSDSPYSEPPVGAGEVLGLVQVEPTAGPTVTPGFYGCFSGDVRGVGSPAGAEPWRFTFSVSPDLEARVKAPAAHVGVCGAASDASFTVGVEVPQLAARYRDAQLAADAGGDDAFCPGARVDEDARAFSCGMDVRLASYLRSRGMEEAFCAGLERATFARLGAEISERVTPLVLRDVVTTVEETFAAVVLAAGAVQARFVCPPDRDVSCSVEDLRLELPRIDWVMTVPGEKGLELTFEVSPR